MTSLLLDFWGLETPLILNHQILDNYSFIQRGRGSSSMHSLMELGLTKGPLWKIP